MHLILPRYPILATLLCLCCMAARAQQIPVNMSSYPATDLQWMQCNGVSVTGASYATPQCRTDLAAPLLAQPPLTIGHATLSGGRIISANIPFFDGNGNLYWSYQRVLGGGSGPVGVFYAQGSSQTITLTFDTGVSGVSFTLEARLLGGPFIPESPENPSNDYVVSDDQNEAVRVQTGYASYVSLYAQNIHRVTITAPNYGGGGQIPPPVSWGFGIRNIRYGAPGILAVDPVPSLLSSNGIVSDPNTLAQSLFALGTPVSAIAADGVARVVLQIKANMAGEHLIVTGIDDAGSWDATDGSFSSTYGSPPAPSLQVTAIDSSVGPVAYAVFLAPADFVRSAEIDDNSPSRTITLQVHSLDVPGYAATSPLKILRPPVVLVHGLWSDSTTWYNFTQVWNDPGQRFFVRPLDYGSAVGVFNAVPDDYPFQSPLTSVSQSALGFSYNAPLILLQVEHAIADFRAEQNAAAAQVDVIAHSMGGDIIRALIKLPRNVSPGSFGLGRVHKLITIGTPHLGTPLPSQLDATICTRRLLATRNKVVVDQVTVSGVVVTGAIADLIGDGTIGGYLSPALRDLQILGLNVLRVPTALIAGTVAGQNLASLGSSPIKTVCGSIFKEQLAQDLTPNGWPTVFAGLDSDAIVPLTSQLPASGTTFPGLIHTVGIAGANGLGFTGPDELSYPPIEIKVIQLLNERVASSSFQPFPQ
jgi:pimeloyl-ACP methyl ester carboxylesterase